MSEELNKDDINLTKKLERVSNPDLKKLAEEAKKIREEIGDNPEIKNIEYDIVNVQSYPHRFVFKDGIRLLFGLTCCSISSFTMVSNHVFDLNSAILFLIGTYHSQEASMNLLGIGNNEKQFKEALNEIKNKIEKLKIMEENKNLKQQLKDAGLIEMEQTENLEGEEHAKRR